MRKRFDKDWIAALFHETNGTDARTTKHFWCSALVAYLYMGWGFLPKDLAWSYVTPKMLGTEKDKYELTFKNCIVESEQPLLQ